MVRCLLHAPLSLGFTLFQQNCYHCHSAQNCSSHIFVDIMPEPQVVVSWDMLPRQVLETQGIGYMQVCCPVLLRGSRASIAFLKLVAPVHRLSVLPHHTKLPALTCRLWAAICGYQDSDDLTVRKGQEITSSTESCMIRVITHRCEVLWYSGRALCSNIKRSANLNGLSISNFELCLLKIVQPRKGAPIGVCASQNGLKCRASDQHAG